MIAAICTMLVAVALVLVAVTAIDALLTLVARWQQRRADRLRAALDALPDT